MQLYIDHNDVANAAFEFGGAFAKALDIKRLMRDKEVRGLHWISILFFVSWGVWNCYFYPNLHQPISTIGGIALATTNMLWLTLLLYYNAKRR